MGIQVRVSSSTHTSSHLIENSASNKQVLQKFVAMADLRILVLGCLAFVAVGAEICVKRGELTTACLFSPNCEPTKNATLIKPLLEELSRLSTGSKRFWRWFPNWLDAKVHCNSRTTLDVTLKWKIEWDV